MKEITLTKGKVAIVDDCDFAEQVQYLWCAQKIQNKWYAARRIGTYPHGKYIYMHREIFGAGEGVEVDHRDGNGLHNWRGNLRAATHAQNQANIGITRQNKSGYKGVSWRRARPARWRAAIKVNQRQIHLGYFDDPADAARAYDAAAREHFGEFAHLNFPD